MNRVTEANRVEAVALITRTMDRALASPLPITDGVATNVASMIISRNNCSDEFEWWPPDAVRAIVIAYAEHAPLNVLKDYVRIAREQCAWIFWFERHQRLERGGRPDVSDVSDADCAAARTYLGALVRKPARAA